MSECDVGTTLCSLDEGDKIDDDLVLRYCFVLLPTLQVIQNGLNLEFVIFSLYIQVTCILTECHVILDM